jgi:arylsulfatase A-like enzyme
VNWLDRRAAGNFFLLVHGYDAHGPYRPPMVFSELYDPDYRGVVHSPGFLQPKVLEGIRDNHYSLSDLVGFEPETGVDWHEPERRRAVLPPFAHDLPQAPASGVASPSVFASRTSVPPAPASTAPARPLPFELPERRLPLSAADLEHLRAHYDGGVTYADCWLAVFLEALAARGLDRNTLVVVMGDHGEDLGEHGRFAHGSALHDNLLHVPLIFSGPGAAAGRRVGQVVQLLDVAPTLLELCGIPASHDHQGRSLARLTGGPLPLPEPASEPAAFAFDETLSSIRTARWHLVRADERELGGPIQESLFEVGADPTESKDVSKDNPVVMAELRGRLVDQLEKTPFTSTRDSSRLSMEERRFMHLMGYW